MKHVNVLAILLLLISCLLLPAGAVFAHNNLNADDDPVQGVEATLGPNVTGLAQGQCYRDKVSSVAVIVTVTDSNGNPISNVTVTFSASPNTTASLSSSSATTNSKGQASINVSSSDVSLDSDSAKITGTCEGVQSLPVTVDFQGLSVSFSPNPVKLGVIAAVTVNASVTPSNDANLFSFSTTGGSEASISTGTANATTGVIPITVTAASGTSGTPAGSPSGDEWIVPSITGNTTPKDPVVVIVPASLKESAGAISVSNYYQATSTPGSNLYVTAAGAYIVVTIYDQFGNVLGSMYDNAPVSENISTHSNGITTTGAPLTIKTGTLTSGVIQDWEGVAQKLVQQDLGASDDAAFQSFGYYFSGGWNNLIAASLDSPQEGFVSTILDSIAGFQLTPKVTRTVTVNQVNTNASNKNNLFMLTVAQ